MSVSGPALVIPAVSPEMVPENVFGKPAPLTVIVRTPTSVTGPENSISDAPEMVNVNVAGRWGFERGFDTYEYLEEETGGPRVYVRSDELNERDLFALRRGQKRLREVF